MLAAILCGAGQSIGKGRFPATKRGRVSIAASCSDDGPGQPVQWLLSSRAVTVSLGDLRAANALLFPTSAKHIELYHQAGSKHPNDHSSGLISPRLACG